MYKNIHSQKKRRIAKYAANGSASLTQHKSPFLASISFDPSQLNIHLHLVAVCLQPRIIRSSTINVCVKMHSTKHYKTTRVKSTLQCFMYVCNQRRWTTICADGRSWAWDKWAILLIVWRWYMILHLWLPLGQYCWMWYV